MTQPIQIAFFDTKPYEERAFDSANEGFSFQFKYLEHRLRADTAILAQGCDAACIFVNDIVDQETIEILLNQGIKLIALRCAGYNNVDLKAVFKRLRVVRVPAYSPEAVAEHAAALMLSLNRKTHRAYYRTRDHNFSIEGLIGFNMFGKTAGIIGMGRIGRALAPILRGLGMQVLCFDRKADAAFAEQVGVSFVGLEELYARSDIISLHCPLVKETYHLLDRSAFDRMKDGVMIINTSRGQLIHTHDLIEALKGGKVGAAGLDVYEEESEYFFEDFSSEIISDDVLARLLTFPNVLITSHQAFFTREAIGNIAQTTLQNIQDCFEGRPLKNEVCYRCGEGTCEKAKNGSCKEQG